MIRLNNLQRIVRPLVNIKKYAPTILQINSNISKNFFSTHSSIASSIIDSTISINEEHKPIKITRKRIERPPPITVTSRAADRIKELISDKEDSDIKGVKISVKRRGCNGYSYTMNYATSEDLLSNIDEKVIDHGVTVLVDPKAIFFIVGTVMDFEETELSSEFTFINPNAKGECGCGESFNV